MNDDYLTRRLHGLSQRKRERFTSEANKIWRKIYNECLDDLPMGVSLDSSRAEHFLASYLVGIEECIRSICEPYDPISLLLLSRSLPATQFGYSDSQAIWSLIRTMTLAILKYSRRPLHKWKTSHDVAIDVKHADVENVVKLFSLCHEHYDASCALRSLWKGASLLLKPDTWEVQADTALERILDLHKRRLERVKGALYTEAGLFKETGSLPVSSEDPFMLCCTPNDQERPKRLAIDTDGPLVTLTYIPIQLSLRELFEYLPIFARSIRSTYRLAPTELVNFMLLLSALLLTEDIGSTLSDCCHRGLVILGYNTLTDRCNHLIDRPEKWFERVEIEMKPDRFLSLLRQFSVCPELNISREAINVQYWEPQYASYIVGDMVVFDLLAAYEFVNGIVWRTQFTGTERNIKSSEFEHEVVSYLVKHASGLEEVFPPGKELRLGGKPRAQVDLSVGKDSMCFLVECKSYGISRKLFEGRPQDLHNRWNTILEWVEKNDKRTMFLAKNPRGDNYVLATRYSHIVPVICTGHPEFLSDPSEHLMLDEHTPRVCTPYELRVFLGSFNKADLASKPYVEKVVRPGT